MSVKGEVVVFLVGFFRVIGALRMQVFICEKKNM